MSGQEPISNPEVEQQQQHRLFLTATGTRLVMEVPGLAVNAKEWGRFDYRDAGYLVLTLLHEAATAASND